MKNIFIQSEQVRTFGDGKQLSFAEKLNCIIEPYNGLFVQNKDAVVHSINSQIFDLCRVYRLNTKIHVGIGVFYENRRYGVQIFFEPNDYYTEEFLRNEGVYE